MTYFRIYLVLAFLVLAAYTGIVIAEHGMSLFAVAARDVAQLGWPGQFDLDFTFLLILSGVWIAYRHRFSGTGIALGLCATVGGVLFTSVYLLVETFRTKGDVVALLLGQNRVEVRAGQDS